MTERERMWEHSPLELALHNEELNGPEGILTHYVQCAQAGAYEPHPQMAGREKLNVLEGAAKAFDKAYNGLNGVVIEAAFRLAREAFGRYDDGFRIELVRQCRYGESHGDTEGSFLDYEEDIHGTKGIRIVDTHTVEEVIGLSEEVVEAHRLNDHDISYMDPNHGLTPEDPRWRKKIGVTVMPVRSYLRFVPGSSRDVSHLAGDRDLMAAYGDVQHIRLRMKRADSIATKFLTKVLGVDDVTKDHEARHGATDYGITDAAALEILTGELDSGKTIMEYLTESRNGIRIPSRSIKRYDKAPKENGFARIIAALMLGKERSYGDEKNKPHIAELQFTTPHIESIIAHRAKHDPFKNTQRTELRSRIRERGLEDLFDEIYRVIHVKLHSIRI